MPFVYWLLPVVLLFALFVGVAIYTARPDWAIGIVLPLVFLFPAWVNLDLGYRNGLDIKFAVTLLMLASYPFLPGASFPWRLVPLDYCILGLFFSNIASDVYHQGVSWVIPATAYVEWIVPYLAGRLAFQRFDLVPVVWPVVVAVGLYLSVLVIIESMTESNLLEQLFGMRPADRAPPEIFRWGFRRSYGICQHPLYMGVLFIWFWGWVCYAAITSTKNRQSIAWLLSVPLLIVATLLTGSRGPVVGLFLVPIGLLTIQYKRIRLPVATISLTVVIILSVFQEPIQTMMDKWSGENRVGRKQPKVLLDDKLQTYSSIRARTLLWPIYRDAVWRGGLLGYGSENCSTFPPNVPLGGQELAARTRGWSVDNSYLLITLRLGWLGFAFFTMAGGLAVWQFLWVWERIHADHRIFVSSMTGALVTILVLALTVWMPMDYGFVLLWTMGMSSGLWWRITYGSTRKN